MNTTEKTREQLDVDLPPRGGGAVQVHTPSEVAQRTDGNAADLKFLDIIDRAMRDPGVDVDKFKTLMEARNAYQDRIAEREFDLALAEVQKEMGPVAANMSNEQTKSKYASHLAMDTMLRPIYSKHAFSLSYNTEPVSAADMVRVVCRLSRGGHHRNYQMDIPADGKGARGGDVMTKTHAAGSAVSYGIRYLMRMIFNLPISGMRGDDDGNAAGSTMISPEQAEELKLLIVETGAEIKAVLKKVKVDKIENIPAKKLDPLVAAIKQWAADQARKSRK